jgi:phosphoribosyl-dephospho-CoA transferase
MPILELPNGKPSNVRPHDLLLLRSVEALADGLEIPEWVTASLAQAPYVVVRRLLHPESMLGIGVRGASRAQRWGGFVHIDKVLDKISPYQLRLSNISELRLKAIPVFEQLGNLEELWQGLQYKWGPGGSVGFELASGLAVTTANSDLDIVIYVDAPLGRHDAQDILRSARLVAPKADILVETPFVAFSLAEYVSHSGRQILLRSNSGPRLTDDPWSEVHIAPAQASEQRAQESRNSVKVSRDCAKDCAHVIETSPAETK